MSAFFLWCHFNAEITFFLLLLLLLLTAVFSAILGGGKWGSAQLSISLLSSLFTNWQLPNWGWRHFSASAAPAAYNLRLFLRAIIIIITMMMMTMIVSDSGFKTRPGVATARMRQDSEKNSWMGLTHIRSKVVLSWVRFGRLSTNFKR